MLILNLKSFRLNREIVFDISLEAECDYERRRISARIEDIRRYQAKGVSIWPVNACLGQGIDGQGRKDSNSKVSYAQRNQQITMAVSKRSKPQNDQV